MIVYRGTGVSVVLKLHQFFSIYIGSCIKLEHIQKHICSWIKMPTKKKNKNECFIITSIHQNVHYC